jgi:flagellar basal-body rod modification protein FlgD
MSTISAQNELINMQNSTAQYEAQQKKLTGTSKEMDSNVFLKLMMEQLKHQDPLSPMDNKEFLAQQAQFTQVDETQKLNKNISTNNSIMQTLALVGKEVTIVDPEDPKKTITGNVTEAGFNGSSSAITIDGKQYPISLIKSVREASSES